MQTPDQNRFRRILARALLACCASLFALLPAAAAGELSGDSIVGDWMVESQDAIVAIRRVGNEYVGSLAWLKDATYDAADGSAFAGRPLMDHQNPDKSKRARPLLGLPLLGGLRYEGRGRWDGGMVYNVEDGRNYRCQVTITDPAKLQLRGYLGLPLFGSTTHWTRVTTAPKP